MSAIRRLRHALQMHDCRVRYCVQWNLNYYALHRQQCCWLRYLMSFPTNVQICSKQFRNLMVILTLTSPFFSVCSSGPARLCCSETFGTDSQWTVLGIETSQSRKALLPRLAISCHLCLTAASSGRSFLQVGWSTPIRR